MRIVFGFEQEFIMLFQIGQDGDHILGTARLDLADKIIAVTAQQPSDLLSRVIVVYCQPPIQSIGAQANSAQSVLRLR